MLLAAVPPVGIVPSVTIEPTRLEFNPGQIRLCNPLCGGGGEISPDSILQISVLRALTWFFFFFNSLFLFFLDFVVDFILD